MTLLQPAAAFSKTVSAAGRWRVRRTEVGRPFYCVVLDGACRLAMEGREPLLLQAGDFVLIPAANNFTTSSIEPPDDDADVPPTLLDNGEFRAGALDAPAEARMVIGYCTFGSGDADMLIGLLPQWVHARGDERLAALARLVNDESRARRPARDLILTRLIEVLLIEALRSATGVGASAGLLRGLADPRLAVAIRCMHASPTRAWTVAQLAKESALSRSAFFERFHDAIGMTPMEYLLGWRMALARKLLRSGHDGIADVAERVGYSSASTFSVAFTRHVGQSPARYARAG